LFKIISVNIMFYVEGVFYMGIVDGK